MKTDKIYCITEANGLSNSATPGTKTTKKTTPWESNARAPDPEERVLYNKNGKNKATVQFLGPKHKVVTSVSERRRMTRISSQTLK